MKILSKKRASDYERMLVNRLWENGFAVMRAPSSSGTSKMPRPDILAGCAKKDLMLVLEVKTCRQDVFYVQEPQIKGLLEFAKRIGGKAFLAVKFVGKRTDFMFLPVPEGLVKSKGDSYRISFVDIQERGLDFLTIIKSHEHKGQK